MQSINPATGEVLATFEEHSDAQVDAILTEVAREYPNWRNRSFRDRGAAMMRAGDYLRAQKARFAQLITVEMGKPIVQAEGEIEKCAWACDYYAEHAAEYLADRPVATTARDSYVAFDPLGPILAVMPWNFPFWQVFRFAAPTLMAGNVAVLKHASNVPQCALAIEEVFQETGFPAGVFRTLLVSSRSVERIIADDRIRGVSLTGSDVAGATVAEVAGRHLKKSVLELGGSDPFIVLRDADLDAAIDVGTTARYQNTGQSCIAAKRFIVEEAIADEFERRYTDAVARMRVGDPLARDTQIGPLARPDLVDNLHAQVRQSVSMGAKVLLGGDRMDGRGNFFQPTILSNVGRGMPAASQETFGPAAALMRARDADEAVALANDTQFGLGAALWTRDVARAREMARRIEAGSVFINGLVASDPRLPFGGVKRSGFGRELSDFGIHEFVNVKTIWIGPPAPPPVPR
ncbi:MAG TPA: NAD-dependent succinate-semialdehyde dehydrogenase [Chloroflexota bacterium]|nr:NAD-dependent succinate-semialdehyde dehydrogenase [Chloroflexota bacterium]